MIDSEDPFNIDKNNVLKSGLGNYLSRGGKEPPFSSNVPSQMRFDRIIGQMWPMQPHKAYM